MLKDDLFTIMDLTGEMPSFRVLLTLNAGHRIFAGHFPGHPVVPGVCLMQIVQEVAETVLSTGPGALRLARADQMKFIAPIDPRNTEELELKLDCRPREDGALLVTASMLDRGKTCFKFTGVFVRE